MANDDTTNAAQLAEFDWSDLHAHTFDPGSMDGDIVVITTADAVQVKQLWDEWSSGEIDMNFATFLNSKGHPSIDACKGIDLTGDKP